MNVNAFKEAKKIETVIIGLFIFVVGLYLYTTFEKDLCEIEARLDMEDENR